MQVRSLQSSAEKYARQSMMVFIQGRQSFSWVTGVIRRSGVALEVAQQNLILLRGVGDAERYQQLANWFDKAQGSELTSLSG